MSIDNKIPKGWVETTLGEVVNIYSGKTRPKTQGRYPIYGGNGILNYGDKYNQDNGTIVIGRVGAYCGNVFFERNKFWLSDNALGVKNTDKSNIIFLYYKLKQMNLNNVAIGAAQPLLTQTLLKELEIVIPQNIEEQKAIAKILTAFDDKIELLQAQNKTLETIAQTIFKEWFGKYQIGGKLPEGWRMYQMSEIVETINGYSYKGKELVEESNEALVTLKSFDRNGGFQTRGFKPFKGKPKPTQEVQIGDLVVAHTDLTQDAEVLGNPAFIFDNGGFEKMYIAMDLVKVVSKHQDISSSFLYYLMKDRAFKGHCVGYSNGTTVLHLSKKAIPEYQVYLPNDFELIKQF